VGAGWVDEAYILSWPGQLETYIPLHDAGGYDRARAPLGSDDYRLDQIKGTASLYSGHRVKISFNTPALHPRRQWQRPSNPRFTAPPRGARPSTSEAAPRRRAR
jgi:hypothetical protein